MSRPWVWYGEERLPLDLPAGVDVRFAGPRPVAPAEDPMGLVAEALDHPHGALPLEEAAGRCGRAVIVVPDATRPSAADVYLLPVIARLARAGMIPRQLSIVMARGIHTVGSRGEVQRILGPSVMDALRTVQSAPDTPEMNVPVVDDEELGEVRVHRLLAAADLVVLTGAVVPHHLTGFGGGPKAFVPGCADRDTVLAAHRLTLRTVVRPDGRVESVAGRHEKNPFRDALLRVARSFGRTWLLNVVLSDSGGIAAAAAGEVGEAHTQAVRLWQELRGEPDAEPADLVIVGAAAPRDRDLVQAHKALIAAAAHAKEGAPIVWFARAPGGPGHKALLPWFEVRKSKDLLAALRREFHPYGLTAYSIRHLAEAHPIHVVSGVDADVLRPMGLLPFEDGGKAVAHALAHHDVRTCVLLGGGVAEVPSGVSP